MATNMKNDSSDNEKEVIDFLIGDIIVDTKYDYGGHVMVVRHINPLRNQVTISHPGFTFPNVRRLTKYNSFKNRHPKKDSQKYIIRWKGPTEAVWVAPSHTVDENKSDGKLVNIRDKITETMNILHYLSRRGKNLDYSRFKGACMFLKNKCYLSNHKVSHTPLHIIQQKESFVCSSYGTFVWKYVLEQFKIPDELKNNIPSTANTLDDIALPINPYECLPKDILSISDKFPDYWEKIPFYTSAMKFIELEDFKEKSIKKMNRNKNTNKNKNKNKNKTNKNRMNYPNTALLSYH
jgi:hypothetical protein